MGVFEHFPYVNFHELNLSWIINKLKELEDVIGSQIVDIVARAGVAANAQAISDLDDRVDTVETTATAAGSAAIAAQNTADSAVTAAGTAQTTADNINTGLQTWTPVTVTGTHLSDFSRLEVAIQNKLLYITFVINNNINWAETETIFTLPANARPVQPAELMAWSYADEKVHILSVGTDGSVKNYGVGSITSRVIGSIMIALG